MTSIRLRLLKWLVGPILLINLAGASLTYMLAWTPAQLAFDQGLADAAAALETRLTVRAGQAALDLPPAAEQVLRANDVDAFYFVVRAGVGRFVAGDRDFPTRVPGVVGAYEETLRGEPVRLTFRSAVIGGESVQIGVARTIRKRLQVRSAVVRALVLLESLFTVALIGLIWFSVTNGLSPLARMRANLHQREAGDLAPVDPSEVPHELEPVVAAFNELLGKVEAGADARQAFLADVAHQLRTPLAGLHLQLEWLGARHRDDPDSTNSIGLMRLSNQRMIRQVNQLLALARAEPSHFEKARLERLDLSQLVAQVVQYFVEEAGKKRIDIGFDLVPAMVAGDSFLLRDLIDNVIDNAVRYTPVGGTVTVSCLERDGKAVLMVDDSGPGIAPEHYSRVFQRFVRLDDGADGSGLGLAIVRDIALAHGALVELGVGDGGAGLALTVSFPPA